MSGVPLQSTLKQDNWRPLKSFKINGLFFVAFFGGVIALVVLGTLNALWLRVERKAICLFIACGVIILTGSLVYGIDNMALFTGLTLILYVTYSQFIKKRYQRFEFFGGAPKSFWVCGVVVSVLARILEFGLVRAFYD